MISCIRKQYSKTLPSFSLSRQCLENRICWRKKKNPWKYFIPENLFALKQTLSQNCFQKSFAKLAMALNSVFVHFIFDICCYKHLQNWLAVLHLIQVLLSSSNTFIAPLHSLCNSKIVCLPVWLNCIFDKNMNKSSFLLLKIKDLKNLPGHTYLHEHWNKNFRSKKC